MRTATLKTIKCPICQRSVAVKGGVITCEQDDELPQSQADWHRDDWAKLGPVVEWTATE